jgi:copper chaperone
MTCGGCSGAITRVLEKAKKENAGEDPTYNTVLVPDVNSHLGVDEFTVSLEKQEVLVTGPIAYDTLLEKIKKTGKEVCNLYYPGDALIY